ncbi:DNA-3-methyladenine glycosylase 1-like [Vanessa atalanta]|uniref:DNA-3-methyladenine glycosylase 1-like n=1 Tax=Vanessa atalanta TaxID=42275 RepID=UPI001FCE2DE5|nr:DNA-3-methyladenine glycosylase 1-like [Vanessa atalanta]
MSTNTLNINKKVIRCGWLNDDPLYISYHDNEWGKPAYDNRYLFEMLCLEGQQAGLSWITILKKRDNYRKLFYNFDPIKIIKFNDNDVERLLSNPDIVRHKGKIESIINNAKCYIDMKLNGEDFSKFVWNFVDNTPIVNNWTNDKEVPSSTEISVAISKALKKKGFKYVGSTTCYAFMQACGLVNDHVTDCISRN